MVYQSVDRLQLTLANAVFDYTKDRKKASGRALETLVEVVMFYLFQSWGLEHSISLERRLPECRNSEITHNVEYTLHPNVDRADLGIASSKWPLMSQRVLATMEEAGYNRVAQLRPRDRFH
jgi:hypothetical protein